MPRKTRKYVRPFSLTPPVLYGIDTYHGDPHPIDWRAVQKGGISFVFLKATEGLGAPDSAFAADWKALGEIGLTRGAYHFLHPELDGAQQAAHFLDAVLDASGTSTLPFGAILALDVETTGGTSPAHIAACARNAANYLIAKTGRAPLLYTSLAFANEHNLGATLGDLPLWLARYTSISDPGAPTGWKKATIWQYAAAEGGPGTDAGGPKPLFPAGCRAPVDSNRFFGDKIAFLQAVGIRSA